MVSQELVDLMQDLPDDGLVLLDRPTIDAARAGGVLAVLFQDMLPLCDLCPKDPGACRYAAFDIHLQMGLWNKVCHKHFEELQPRPILGPGRGQRLMLYSPEVSYIPPAQCDDEELEEPLLRAARERVAMQMTPDQDEGE